MSAMSFDEAYLVVPVVPLAGAGVADAALAAACFFFAEW
jgi:hypothetical protein